LPRKSPAADHFQIFVTRTKGLNRPAAGRFSRKGRPTDLIIATQIGEPHEPAGAVAVRRHERLGAYDDARRRWRVEVDLEVTEVRSLSRSSSVRSALEAAQEMAAGEGRRSVLVDVGKAGAALQIAEEIKLRAIPIVIGDSLGARVTQRMLAVGKPELVTALARAIEEDRLRVSARDAAELSRQLTGFTVARRSRAEQPVAQRDELVMAMGLGCWWSAMRLRPLTPQPRPPRRPIESEPLTWDRAAEAVRRRLP
jgi:hypothetical protein